MVVHASTLCRFSAAIFLALPTLSYAVESKDSHTPSPWYAGASIGWTRFHNGCEPDASACDKDDIGIGAMLGHRFTHKWGAELSYLDFGQASASYPTSNGSPHQGMMRGWSLSAVGQLPLSPRVNLLGKVGTLRWNGQVKSPSGQRRDQGWVPVVSAGLGVQLNQRWALSITTSYADGAGSPALGGTNLWLSSVGLQYHFGASPTPSAPAPAKILLPALHRDVHFDFDSAVFNDPAPLADIVSRLQRHPGSRVIVQGFSDATGDQEYNLSLSDRRAQAVADYLTSRGIESHRITIEDFGERQPVIDNATPQHRAQNRRVHLYVPGMEVSQ
ncbi:OmpA family protein [Marinobacter hydrocarbonoclasticus]|nr:OmpA family protein [Marinobacter nauticus]